jgi:hypothetical protein
MLVEVSERELKKFLKKSDDFESMSTITRLMNIANELKEAGLQPVFFIDSETELLPQVGTIFASLPFQVSKTHLLSQ